MPELDQEVQDRLKALTQWRAPLPADAREQVVAEVRRRQRRWFAASGLIGVSGVVAAVIGGLLVVDQDHPPAGTVEVPVATTSPSVAPSSSATAKATEPRPRDRAVTLAEVARLNRHDLLLQPPRGEAQVTRQRAIRVVAGQGLGGPPLPIQAWLRTATTKTSGRWVDGHFRPEVDHRLMWVVAVEGARVPILGPPQGSGHRPQFYRTTVVHLVDAHTGQWIGAWG